MLLDASNRHLMRFNMATHCGRDFETLISLRFTITYAPTRDGWEVEPIISLRVTITLPRVIGVMTSDYSKSQLLSYNIETHLLGSLTRLPNF